MPVPTAHSQMGEADLQFRKSWAPIKDRVFGPQGNRCFGCTPEGRPALWVETAKAGLVPCESEPVTQGLELENQ